MQFLAVDWSGNATAAAQHTAVAVVREGRLISVETGRTGLADHLRELAQNYAENIIGLDFAFSVPAWFLRERGYLTVEDLWRAARSEGEEWLRGTGPFWGRPGVKKPELPEHFRRTDSSVPSVGGITPKSVFQVGGAGAVGTGSIRGMPFLHDMVDRGFHIWPFEIGLPLVIEIYPRALTGAVVKSSSADRRTYLRDPPWGLQADVLELAAATEDTFDAAVSALVMSHHAYELGSLAPTEDSQTLPEGAIWIPASVPVSALPMTDSQPTLSDTFEEALVFAARVHRDQLRKGSDLPYSGHLLGVASIVIEEGGDQDLAIAALLHDAVEDRGGLPMLATIRAMFGDRVAGIVRGCSDAVIDPKPPWQERKEQYLSHLESATKDVLLVSLADKLFNARAILADHHRVGTAVWERFRAGPDSQLWYYRSLANTFLRLGDKVPVLLARELDQVVTEIEQVAQQEAPDP
jgi:HD domain/Protein of unknown function (DUF429)